MIMTCRVILVLRCEHHFEEWPELAVQFYAGIRIQAPQALTLLGCMIIWLEGPAVGEQSLL